MIDRTKFVSHLLIRIPSRGPPSRVCQCGRMSKGVTRLLALGSWTRGVFMEKVSRILSDRSEKRRASLCLSSVFHVSASCPGGCPPATSFRALYDTPLPSSPVSLSRELIPSTRASLALDGKRSTHHLAPFPSHLGSSCADLGRRQSLIRILYLHSNTHTSLLLPSHPPIAATLLPLSLHDPTHTVNDTSRSITVGVLPTTAT